MTIIEFDSNSNVALEIESMNLGDMIIFYRYSDSSGQQMEASSFICTSAFSSQTNGAVFTGIGDIVTN